MISKNSPIKLKKIKECLKVCHEFKFKLNIEVTWPHFNFIYGQWNVTDVTLKYQKSVLFRGSMNFRNPFSKLAVSFGCDQENEKKNQLLSAFEMKAP